MSQKYNSVNPSPDEFRKINFNKKKLNNEDLIGELNRENTPNEDIDE